MPSDVLKDYSTDWVAYEFMNEPVADEHEQWNLIIEKVHKALREREPNIILSFHYYNPMLLTHHGAFWTPVGRYKGDITYPGT